MDAHSVIAVLINIANEFSDKVNKRVSIAGLLLLFLLLLPHPAAPINPVNRLKKMRMCVLLLMALLQIGSGDKLSSLFTEGAAYELLSMADIFKAR
ncbi:hypothetical protein B7R70_10205 [Yersinia pseudotuberculosis]|uniref:Uncharacterized protein n=1 Tax=Yersinia pseudotuberculosis TaxID=633 RepID=A0ABN5R4S6_YERPU|nr:hypothetical protein [Yersinia pseudotuberculosis]AYW91891.1 hypothetical protein EGX47_11605 [Yersinia pseudotuberculosis]AYW96183.1 hypothetical protein EGX39_10370 [Yersinia pseudotuberculosis]AYX16959.1 hypothetical protein EGX44_18405 [Yersinia pseudotuberculosis]MBO1611140.1 hypothetical protein [Yersinia pseudotuberculosis]PSH19804.1 hypothetical protein BLA52_06655 [Yersinia pseudotuberculosis]